MFGTSSSIRLWMNRIFFNNINNLVNLGRTDPLESKDFSEIPDEQNPRS